MFVCYGDESGFTGVRGQPHTKCLVVAGVLANAYNMHKTQGDFSEIEDYVSGKTGKTFLEVKGQELYRGKGQWKGVGGKTRHDIYGHILSWFKERGHKVAISAIDLHAFQAKLVEKHPIASAAGSPYVTAVLHLALMIQKKNQGLKKNKGKTLLIMDQQTQEEKLVSHLLASSPSWTDSYYGWKNGEKLDQILDTAYFVRSHHASFVQIADLIAFAVNRYLELQTVKESYAGEKAQREKWFRDLICPTFVGLKYRLPSGKSDILNFYRSVTPQLLGGSI